MKMSTSPLVLPSLRIAAFPALNPDLHPLAFQDYRLLAIYSLRHIKVLDGQPVALQELAAARGRYSGQLTIEFLVRYSGPEVEWRRSRLGSAAGSILTWDQEGCLLLVV